MEVSDIKIKISSSEKDVLKFINDLFTVINNEHFIIEKNLVFISKKKYGEEEKYSTPYTLADLDYDSSDVLERVKELTVKDYSETLYDRDDDNPPLLFVFGKNINGKEIYIKLKVRDEKNKVICLSFHYAEYSMQHPYR
ncbi:hypothetical protein [Anaerocolumna sp. AGMB13025]|uniref:hypothetical protein n=1 Tax=Anaerocolumna sp. AGMB13025 TaxID=3039116 RepID=UPI003FA4C79B